MQKKHIGSSFDDFLKEEGIYVFARCIALFPLTYLILIVVSRSLLQECGFWGVIDCLFGN
jgi:hypothetical protein